MQETKAQEHQLGDGLFATTGPGGLHLLTGLYDAREDRAPVLAISGQV